MSDFYVVLPISYLAEPFYFEIWPTKTIGHDPNRTAIFKPRDLIIVAGNKDDVASNLTAFK